MEKTLLSILISLTLASASTIVNEKSLLEGYGVQDVNDYQESGWGEVLVQNAKLQWKVSNTAVTFNLTIDPILLVTDQSYRIGFSNPSVSRQEYDYVKIYFDNLELIQENSIKQGYIERNKYNSFYNVSGSKKNGNLWVSWSRRTNVITDETIRFLEGNKYFLSLNGIVEITLSNGFSMHYETRKDDNLEKANLELITQYYGVMFNLEIDPSFTNDYDWYEIGLKSPSENFSMSYADYNVVMLKDQKITLMNTFDGSETPTKNTVNNTIIPLAWGPTVHGTLSIIWTRDFQQASNQTIRILERYEYTLIYAYGKSSPSAAKYGGKGHKTIYLGNSFPDDSALSVCSLLGLLAIQLII